jgi:hypothetical protein
VSGKTPRMSLRLDSSMSHSHSGLYKYTLTPDPLCRLQLHSRRSPSITQLYCRLICESLFCKWVPQRLLCLTHKDIACPGLILPSRLCSGTTEGRDCWAKYGRVKVSLRDRSPLRFIIFSLACAGTAGNLNSYERSVFAEARRLICWSSI